MVRMGEQYNPRTDLALPPGTRLGPYEIVSTVGTGGMGEVYRATDTTLKRQVAIKVLPPALAGDAHRMARFQREAELLAALSHPNIATRILGGGVDAGQGRQYDLAPDGRFLINTVVVDVNAPITWLQHWRHSGPE